MTASIPAYSEAAVEFATAARLATGSGEISFDSDDVEEEDDDEDDEELDDEEADEEPTLPSAVRWPVFKVLSRWYWRELAYEDDDDERGDCDEIVDDGESVMGASCLVCFVVDDARA